MDTDAVPLQVTTNETSRSPEAQLRDARKKASAIERHSTPFTSPVSMSPPQEKEASNEAAKAVAERALATDCMRKPHSPFGGSI